jgi:hypothetical protein
MESSYVGGVLSLSVQTRTEASREAEMIVDGFGKDMARTWTHT